MLNSDKLFGVFESYWWLKPKQAQAKGRRNDDML